MDDALCLLQVKLYYRHITDLAYLTSCSDITSFTKKAANAAFFNNTDQIARLFFQFVLSMTIQRLPLALSHG